MDLQDRIVQSELLIIPGFSWYWTRLLVVLCSADELHTNILLLVDKVDEMTGIKQNLMQSFQHTGLPSWNFINNYT